jgi:peptidoglycan hydrolase-like protein with peptidoglycan-binding domain
VSVCLLAAALVPCAKAAAAPSAPAAPPGPASATVQAAPAAPGSIRLTVLGLRGSPPFAIAGQRIIVLGTVSPYVAGQQVKFSVYRDGRKVAVHVAEVTPGARGLGRAHLVYSSSAAGLVQVRAAHYANASQSLFTGRSRSVRFVSTFLSEGSQGGSVWQLQAELAALHYDVPQDGSFEAATGRAVIAYRKLTGLERVPYTNTRIFALLQQGDGGFRVRYRSDGKHVEADLSKQVLAEIEPGGRVHEIFDISSGKPSTPTVIGRFRVYEKTPGYNSEAMLDSNYFIAGYAIHGYAEVPTFAASHGCLRVPIPNAASIYAWVQLGTPVDVYDDYGGGSTHVRGNAGP